MKGKRILAILAVAAVVAALCTAAAYTAGDSLLQSRVSLAAEKDKVTYTTLYNIDAVTSADLLSAGQLAVSRGGKVLFNFDTLEGNTVVGRVVVNPLQAADTQASYNFKLDTSSAAVAAVAAQFEALLGQKVAVVRCAHLDYGMPVVVCAKLDISGMDTGNLTAYSYSRSADTWEQLDSAAVVADSSGFVCVKTQQAGYLIITQAQ